MKAPAFWDRSDHLCAQALRPLGALYGAVAARRLRAPAPKADLAVLMVGGLTVGGAGKTPLALALCALAQGAGRAPAFLTRGYRGRAGAGPVRVTGQSPADIGDEALLLAQMAPTFVGFNRLDGAHAAKAFGADLVICDDGLQSRRIAPDFTLCALDGASGLGNGLRLPAGPLRAPLEAQLPLVDAFVTIGAPVHPSLRFLRDVGKPVFRAQMVARNGEALSGARVLAVSGIARPEKFHASLRAIGAEIFGARAFPDHHAFSQREISALAAQAQAAGAALVTTAKDYARWPAGAPAPHVLEMDVVFDDAAAIWRLAQNAL